VGPVTTQAEHSAAAAAAAAHDEQIACPLCDYDLRGLIEPRCPECGYTFEWPDLREPARRKHKYLFEHHPERNVRSFLRTMFGGLRPRKFWGGLLPSQPSYPRRMFAYALVIVVLTAIPPVAAAGLAMKAEWDGLASRRAAQLVRWRGVAITPQMQQQLDRYYTAPTLPLVTRNTLRYNRSVLRIVFAHVTMFLWPGLTLAALMIFQFSLRRARLRPVHLARCAVYCGDVMLWANLLLAGLVAAAVTARLLTGARRPPGDPVEAYAGIAGVMMVVAVVTFIYRLAVALKKYLRFDRPLWTMLATQVMVFLVVLIVALNLGS
jgi:hypothetical protein